MNFLRAILASLLSLTCALSVSAFVTLATLQTTLLDRQEVKTWLQQSGVYKSAIGTIIGSNQTAQDQVSSTSSAISPNSLKTALNQTFTPTYVQQQSEKIIDNTFDWLDGKTPMIALNINATDQKDAFVNNAAAAIQPQLASLPTCRSINSFNAQNPTCLPPGTSAADAAKSIATDAGNQISLFQQPLTNQSLAKANTESGQSNTNSPLTSPNSSAQQLPNITSNIHLWLWLLPLLAIVSGGLSILLTRDHLKAAKHLARRLTISLGVAFVIGLLLTNFGKTVKLSDFTGTSNAVVSNIIEPIVHQAAPAIGGRLALVSGILGAITLGLWITFQTLWENRERAKLLTPPDDETPSVPINAAHAPSVLSAAAPEVKTQPKEEKPHHEEPQAPPKPPASHESHQEK